MNDRASAWFDAAIRHGLWFAETDEHGGASLPFGLCRRGDHVAIRNVSCGAIGGRQVRTFDLDVMVPNDDSATLLSPGVGIAGLSIEAVAGGAGEYSARERWECAMTRAGAECLRLSIVPEGLRTALADIVTLGDQDLELEAFNRAFEVRADDLKFANDFLDARMIELLVERAVGWIVETVGDRILVARPVAAVPEVDELLELAFAVADRVPNAVKTLYPTYSDGELTPMCPLASDGGVREIEAHEVGAIGGFDPWPDVPSGWA